MGTSTQSDVKPRFHYGDNASRALQLAALIPSWRVQRSAAKWGLARAGPAGLVGACVCVRNALLTIANRCIAS
jgi:hypothetical protein